MSNAQSGEGMLIALGHFITEPALEEELVSDLRGHRPSVADGCLFYSFATDDPGRGSVRVAECWRDKASLDAHFTSPHMQAFLAKWGDRITVDVTMYDAANPHRYGE